MYWLHHNRLRSDSFFPTLTRSHLCHSDSGGELAGNSSGGSGTGGADSVGGSQSNGADTTPGALAPWDQFARGLEQLNESLAPRLDALRQDVTRLPDAMRPPPQEPPAPDWDSMTQADLASHLTTHITGSVLKAVEAAITKSIEPLAARVNETQSAHFKTTVESEMRELQGANKDFADWKPEMVALAKVHPTLGLAQLYKLAKADNPTKANELDSRYNPKPPPPTRWGGLTPALGGATNGSKPLSKEEAGRQALAEVKQRHPGILDALEAL